MLATFRGKKEKTPHQSQHHSKGKKKKGGGKGLFKKNTKEKVSTRRGNERKGVFFVGKGKGGTDFCRLGTRWVSRKKIPSTGPEEKGGKGGNCRKAKKASQEGEARFGRGEKTSTDPCRGKKKHGYGRGGKKDHPACKVEGGGKEKRVSCRYAKKPDFPGEGGNSSIGLREGGGELSGCARVQVKNRPRGLPIPFPGGGKEFQKEGKKGCAVGLGKKLFIRGGKRETTNPGRPSGRGTRGEGGRRNFGKVTTDGRRKKGGKGTTCPESEKKKKGC